MLNFKEILSKSFILVFSDIFSKGIIFIVNILLARSFGPEIFGLYSFALGISTILSFISELGLNRLILLEASEDSNDLSHLVSAAWSIRLISLFLLVLPTCFVIYKFSNLASIRLLVSLNVFIVFQNIYEFYLSILKVKYVLKTEAIIKAVLALSILGLYSYIIFSKSSIFIFAYGYAGLMILFSFITFLVVQNKYKHPFKLLSVKSIGAVLKKSWPFGLSLVFISIYYNLDSVMIGLYFNETIVGLYSAAYKLLVIILTLQNLFSIIVLPNIRNNISRPEKLRNYIEKISLIMNTFQVLIIAGMIYLSTILVPLMYGANFKDSIIPFSILSVNVVFVGWSIISGIWVLSSFGKEKVMTMVVGIGAVSNILLNFILIPRFNMVGASFATIFSELLVAIIMYIQARKYLNFNFIKKGPKILLAIIISVGASLLIPFNPIISLLIFICCYCFFIYILGVINKDSFNLLSYEKN